MFSFLSLLVEDGLFESVKVNFQIVGHTHGDIDRYFSVLSRAKKRCEWVGSALSLHSLYYTCHEEESQQPRFNSMIDVVYDYVSALKPFINKDIKYISIPHCFVFTKVLSKCIMQYRLYFDSEYFPKMPKIVQHVDAIFSNACSVTCGPAPIFNGYPVSSIYSKLIIRYLFS